MIFGGGIPSLADQIVDENFDQLNVGRAQMISLAFWGVWAWGQHLVFSKVHVAFFFALDHEHVWVEMIIGVQCVFLICMIWEEFP